MDLDALRLHFREAFTRSPAAAYREWFRAQEELRASELPDAACVLADDLWESIPALRFDSAEARARFLHNLGAFFGTPGPAADLARAREAFAETLAHYAYPDEAGWRARALHNLASSIANLGASPAELEEAARLFEEALAWRTSEREIARGVSLHHLGIALCRWAELEPSRAAELLDRSVTVLSEAAGIRERHGLADGLAATRSALQDCRKRLENATSGTFGPPERPRGVR